MNKRNLTISQAKLRRLGEFERICESMQKTLEKEGITRKQLLAGLPEARKQVFRELYPTLAAEEDL